MAQPLLAPAISAAKRCKTDWSGITGLTIRATLVSSKRAIVLTSCLLNVHVLLVTINKQGKADDHRYVDHWIDERTFHWQSQNQTGPDDKRGRSIIEHEKQGISIHLFVRETKLANGKAAPFVYCGPVRYVRHTGGKPMSVIFDAPEMG